MIPFHTVHLISRIIHLLDLSKIGMVFSMAIGSCGVGDSIAVVSRRGPSVKITDVALVTRNLWRRS